LEGIKLWDMESGEKIGGLNQALATVWTVAFSPDGKTVASTGSKRVIGPRDNGEDEAILRLWEWIPPKKTDR
jgi:WD40 repeat protein